jgi:NADH:ubiquinone oxidoreductase subunit 6 (subunit J)
MYTVNMLLIVALVAAALWTVMTARLLRAVVALAVTSVLVTVLMFQLHAPIAGVFELSVCAGLIPAILITTISLTQRLDAEQLIARKKEKLRKYWPLPLLVIVAAILLSRVNVPLEFPAITTGAGQPIPKQEDVRTSLWALRHIDLLGQIVILLAGAFAVVVLVREKKSDGR